jgi:hypothetical protein
MPLPENLLKSQLCTNSVNFFNSIEALGQALGQALADRGDHGDDCDEPPDCGSPSADVAVGVAVKPTPHATAAPPETNPEGLPNCT